MWIHLNAIVEGQPLNVQQHCGDFFFFFLALSQWIFLVQRSTRRIYSGEELP